MESGCDDEKAAAKDLEVWKAMLHKEAWLNWESEIRLKRVPTQGFKNRNPRHQCHHPQKYRQHLSGNNAQCGKHFTQSHPAHKSYTKTCNNNTNFQRKPVQQYDNQNKGNNKTSHH